MPVLLPRFGPTSGLNGSFLLTNQLSLATNFEKCLKMSFGWSASDVAECVKILIKVGKALKDSGGSAAKYQSAISFLKGVETTVQGVEVIFRNQPGLTFEADFQEHGTNLIAAVTHFRKQTEGYDTSLGVNPTSSDLKKAWKKIKLALFIHIEELKLEILYPQSIVNDLIGLQNL